MRPTCGSNVRLLGRYGAGEQPQFPATMVVIPCSNSGASTRPWSGCGITQSLCECMSMNPGATTLPVQSTICAALAPCSAPSAAIRPSTINTEPGTASAPVPSRIVPPRRIRSQSIARPLHDRRAGRRGRRTGRQRWTTLREDGALLGDAVANAIDAGRPLFRREPDVGQLEAVEGRRPGIEVDAVDQRVGGVDQLGERLVRAGALGIVVPADRGRLLGREAPALGEDATGLGVVDLPPLELD